MYNPEEDIIPQELLDQALQVSQTSTRYKVYFDKDTGDILSITNEENLNFSNSIELDYSVVKDFFTGKKLSTNYKIMFVNQTTPAIVLKHDTDVNIISIEEIPSTRLDGMLTIENYPIKSQWAFRLDKAQKESLKEHNLNTSFEIFVVDKDDSNLLVRSIKLFLKDLMETDKLVIPHESKREKNLDNKVFVRKFFSTVGYQISYDTNS